MKPKCYIYITYITLCSPCQVVLAVVFVDFTLQLQLCFSLFHFRNVYDDHL